MKIIVFEPQTLDDQKLTIENISLFYANSLIKYVENINCTIENKNKIINDIIVKFK